MALKAMMSVQMVQMLIDMEPKELKTKVIISACVFGLSAVIIDGFYWARVDSIMNMQSRYEEDPRSDSSRVAYDIACNNGPFSDAAEALSLQMDLAKDCDSDC